MSARALVVLLAACAACGADGASAGGGGAGGGEGSAPPSQGGGAPQAEVTYHGFVRSFVEQHCLACHTQDGAAPIHFADWETFEPLAAAVVDAVESGRMPPFLPRDGCRPVASLPLVTEEEIAKLEAFREEGFVEGDPADYQGPPPVELDLGEPTLVLSARPFTPPLGNDTMREQTFEGVIDVDTWMTASSLEPSGSAIVHHASAFVEAPGGGSMRWLMAAHAPGYAPLRMPQGSALLLPQGSSIELVVHYSTIGLAAGETVPADVTTLRLWTLPAGELPSSQAFFERVALPELTLPAFDPEITASHEVAVDGLGATIAGVMPLMHQLGVSFRAEVLRAQQDDACLLDVPRFDVLHPWLAVFEDDALLPVFAGDRLRMTCVFDNSAANQPLVGGMPCTPTEVVQGDEIGGELCAAALLRVLPLP